MRDLPAVLVNDIVSRALAEDVGLGDVTTLATVPADLRALADVVSKDEGLIAGLPVMAATFRLVEEGVACEPLLQEGAPISPGDVIAHIAGPARAQLTAARTALNFLQRLSGIATLTSRYVAAVAGTGVQVLDTRKTTPGLRLLEKYAVRVGGGRNHRFGLFDGVLIKDNHIAAAGSISAAVSRVRASAHHLLKIEVEVSDLAQLDEALFVRADVIMLDNMSLEEVRGAVETIRGRARVELSGGITLDTVRSYAECGADFLSAGALTHSAPSLDISLEFRG